MAHRPDLSDTGGPRLAALVSPSTYGSWSAGNCARRSTGPGLDRGHMEYRDPARARAASRGYCQFQASLQRLLRNGFGRATPNIRHPESDRDRMHYQCLRRVRLSAMRCSVTTSACYWKTAQVSLRFRARRFATHEASLLIIQSMFGWVSDFDGAACRASIARSTSCQSPPTTNASTTPVRRVATFASSKSLVSKPSVNQP